MNTHIVRVNESLDKIALIYCLTKEEIIKNNTHIKDWNRLIPGTKLKLPIISDIVENQLDNTEPFIEDYYPRLDPIKTGFVSEEIPVQSTNVEASNIEETKIENKPKKINKPHQVPYYYNGYPYYGYYGNSYGPYSTNKYYRFKNQNRSKKK